MYTSVRQFLESVDEAATGKRLLVKPGNDLMFLGVYDRRQVYVYVEREVGEDNIADCKDFGEVVRGWGMDRRSFLRRHNASILVGVDLENSGFDWHWNVEKNGHEGVDTGRLTVRLDKFCRTHYGQRLTAKTKELVGEYARRHMIARDGVQMDFTSNLFWHEGSFGDDGSCFFERMGVRSEMTIVGVFASRYYLQERENSKRGSGRCWLFPGWKNERYLLATNFYGSMHREQHAHLIENLLTDGMGTKYTHWIMKDGSYDCCWSSEFYLNCDANLFVPEDMLTGERPRITEAHICALSKSYIHGENPNGRTRYENIEVMDAEYETSSGGDYDEGDEDYKERRYGTI